MNAVDVIDAVCDRIKTVEGVGPNVYNMLRNSITEAQFKQIFFDATTDPANPIVRAWRVTRVGFNDQDEAMNAVRRTHTIEISGFMSYKDGVSEPIFQTLIDAIADAFDPLGGGNGSSLRRFVDAEHPDGRFDWSGPMAASGPRLGTLGNALVHAVVFTYPVQQFPL